MKDIILEIDFDIGNTIEIELIKLGGKCDVDLDHTPFKEFSVRLTPTKECYNDLIKETAKRYAKRYINEHNLNIDALKHLELINDFEKELKSKTIDFNREIDVEFNDKGMRLTQYDFHADILINKRKFNMLDDDLEFKIEIKYYENPDSSLFNYSLEKEIFNNTRLVFGICAFLQTSKVEVPYTKKVNLNNHHKKSSKKKNKGNKKTYLYNKVYKINKNTLEDATSLASNIPSSERGKRTYHISSWYQRGHWRTYKNGKSVWIEAQFKHPRNISKEDDTKKTYKITKM